MSDPATQPRTGKKIRSTKVANRRMAVRDRLLETGARLFAERGLSNVSVEDLIDAVGISRATFYGFFGNKSELAVAVLIPVFESGVISLSATMPREPRAKAERLKAYSPPPSALCRRFSTSAVMSTAELA